jgi:hypothetical protein
VLVSCGGGVSAGDLAKRPEINLVFPGAELTSPPFLRAGDPDAAPAVYKRFGTADDQWPAVLAFYEAALQERGWEKDPVQQRLPPPLGENVRWLREGLVFTLFESPAVAIDLNTKWGSSVHVFSVELAGGKP